MKLNTILTCCKEYGILFILFLFTERLLFRLGRCIPYYYWVKYKESRWLDPLRMWAVTRSLRDQPMFVLIAIDEIAKRDSLKPFIESVKNQVYNNWKMEIVTTREIKSMLKNDPRVRIITARTVYEGLNGCLGNIQGDYGLIVTTEWLLAPNCLLEVALHINSKPTVDIVYFDHDNIDLKGRRFAPVFKPQWCPESFLSGVFSVFPFACRANIAKKIGALHSESESCLEWDIGLRVAETDSRIERIPAVLFHRIVKDDNELQLIKTRKMELGILALKRFLQKRGEKQYTISNYMGNYQFIIRYKIEKSGKVSIIIPTKDHHTILNSCLRSIFEKSMYRNFDVLVIDNQSRMRSTIRILNEWKKKYPEKITVVSYWDNFNYSRINNYGVSKTDGQYILFLNNDVEVISGCWLEAMIEYAQKTEIGAVGAMLLYPNGRVQHAGVVLGIGGIGEHVFRYFRELDESYCCRLQTINNYSAVTGACLMCRRDVFRRAGGFNEDLEIDFGDIDLCLKFIELGYRNVYLPHVKLYHYESLTRKKNGKTEKEIRLKKEMAYMESRWREYISDDPCYNPNLTRQRSDFSVAIELDKIKRLSSIGGC